MRQLVTIRTVKELVPIDGADRIELAKVDGWQMVVSKGEFKAGDRGVMFEIDSVLPADDERFAFMEQRKFRVRTIKLRGQLSQGLFMPLSKFPEAVAYSLGASMVQDTLGENLADLLRVQKYEPPVPIAGQQKGNFPTHLVPKTDQERIQNIPDVLFEREAGEFEITEKLDGTSCTFYWHNPYLTYAQCPPDDWEGPEFGACSRNWEMDLDDDNVYATLWRELDMQKKLRELRRNIAIQGEIIGPRIQGNKYKRAKQEFYVFDMYDIDEQRYLWPVERIKLAYQLELSHVPHLPHILETSKLTGITPRFDLESVLDAADGKSQLFDTPREGLVFKHHGRKDGSQAPLSFKAISNKWLLKNE